MNLTWMKTTFSMAQPSLGCGKHPSSQVFCVCIISPCLDFLCLRDGKQSPLLVMGSVSHSFSTPKMKILMSSWEVALTIPAAWADRAVCTGEQASPINCHREAQNQGTGLQRQTPTEEKNIKHQQEHGKNKTQGCLLLNLSSLTYMLTIYTLILFAAHCKLRRKQTDGQWLIIGEIWISNLEIQICTGEAS